MRKVLFAFFVAIPFFSSAVAQQTMSESGQIVSVRLVPPRAMTVRSEDDGEVIRYRVPRGAEVTLAGQPGRLGFLRSGDVVNITYTNSDDGREAATVGVPQPTSAMDQRIVEGEVSTITGRVERVSAANRTLTVLGDQSGQRFTYAIPENSPLTMNGQNATLRDFRVGDQVTLRFTEESGARQATRVRVPTPSTPLAQRRVEQPPAGAAAQPARTELPRTAGEIPFVFWFGLLALAGAVVIRVVRNVARD